MDKGLKYLLLMLLLIFGRSTESKPKPEPSLCDGLTKVELWGEYYDIATTYSLDLYNQKLTDSILPEIGCLTNLIFLSLGFNELTGEIPSEIGNLTNLTRLGLNSNQLTGSIPSEIGNLTNLTLLVLSNNQLSGDIPPEVCDLIESNNLKMDHILGFVGFTGNNLTNCGEKVREEITERYGDGKMKTLVKFKGSGSEEMVRKREYYENGQIYNEENFKERDARGKWTVYNNDGSIKKVEEYKNGELVE